MSNCSSTDCVFDVELFLIVSTQDILWTSNIFYKCYGVSESLIQLLSAKVCKRFFSFFFSSTAHMNTPTHLSITNRFPVSCGTLSPPFPGFLPKITKVTFSKVIFFFFNQAGESAGRLEWSMLFFVAKHSRMSFWIPFLKIMQIEMVFWKLISHPTPQKYIQPWCNKVMLQINGL